TAPSRSPHPSFPYPIPFFTLPRPPRSTLFPYTTLFRSSNDHDHKSAPATTIIMVARTPPIIWWLRVRTRIDFAMRFHFLCDLYRSEEHTSELQSRENLVCRLLLEKKKKKCRIATTLSSI